MQAARLRAYGQPLVIEDVPRPTPGPGQVVIRVEGAGFCDYCVAGEENLCPTMPWVGMSEHEGGYAEYLLVPALKTIKPELAVSVSWLKELMADRGRPHDNLYEVAVWADLLRVQGNELFYAYMVDNQAIVIPETIDAIRALHGGVRAAHESIALTDTALGIASTLI